MTIASTIVPAFTQKAIKNLGASVEGYLIEIRWSEEGRDVEAYR